ncbi:hypothetical protein SNE40_010242 [Patella caerulea]|uniref:WxxW domain-containing protein n=1 Tax=Patella caerulea TaxID=87958 RepID=A0AAN8PZP4_PATCE
MLPLFGQRMLFTTLLLVASLQIAASQTECTKWTKWYNRDRASGTGDWETLADLRKENQDQICEKPSGIDAQLLDGRHYTAGGDKVTINPTTGLICLNRIQNDGRCNDYKVRFCCDPIVVVPECKKWTRWYDRDNESGTGDWETLADLRKDNPGQICEKPSGIDAQLLDGRHYTAGGDKVTINPTTGLICLNRIQNDRRCNDYKVRFCCDPIVVVPECKKWTRWYDRDNESGTGDWETLADLRKDNPGQICEKPSGIDAQLLDGRHYTAGGDKVTINPTTGLICLNRIQNDRRCNDYKVRFCCDPIVPECKKWTQWYDRDNESGTGDWETLADLRKEKPGQICEKPSGIDAQLLDGRHYTAGGDKVTINPTTGLICLNRIQNDRRCNDYKVRFCCDPIVPECKKWTQWYDRDNESGTGDWETLADLRKEKPGQICEKPSGIDAQLLDGRHYTAGGDKVTINPTTGLICENKNQDDKKCNDYKVRFCCDASI